MKQLKTGLCGLVVALLALSGTGHAQVAFQIVGEGMATDISADGSVVVGNLAGNYETFRWSKSTGIVHLGRYAIHPAGSPDVSDDGTKISATISYNDTLVTQGLWTLGSGWQELMPPQPPDGGILGAAYGSAWGLSGDGKTAVGLYWRPGQPGGSAHASKWTEATGVVDLGADYGNSRANDADYDGDVVVGWDEDTWGGWRPTVWVDGVRTNVATYDAFCEATCVTPDGKTIAGQAYDTTSAGIGAAVWRWNGSSWDEEYLGVVPGTFPGYGLAIANDITADGNMVVGYNRFDFAPVPTTGFIWTPTGGMVDVETFLSDNGVEVPSTYDIQSLSGVSDDGTVMTGIGQNTFFPYNYRFFVIYIGDAAVGVGDPPARFEMGQNYPNPFNPTTTIPVTIAQSGPVRMDIFNVNGQRVRTLHDGELPAGTHQFSWNGVDEGGVAVASGVYFARISDFTGASTSRRMVLLK